MVQPSGVFYLIRAKNISGRGCRRGRNGKGLERGKIIRRIELNILLLNPTWIAITRISNNPPTFYDSLTQQLNACASLNTADDFIL